ncbi:MAG: transglutaminase-like domain-containing protein [Thermoguttaceae bacterium]
MTLRIGGLVMVCLLACAATASAQFQAGDENSALLGESRSQRWKGGVTVKAVGGPCNGIVATIPVPVDWPEQTVIISDEDVSEQAKVNQGKNVKAVPQMVVNIRSLRSGMEARAILTYDVTRYAQKPPEDVEKYRIPEDKDVPRDLRIYLGPSLPHIDCRDDRIRQLGDSLGVDQPYAWKRVEAIFDYVRGKIEFSTDQKKRKGGIQALEDKKGNHEDMCFAFIAICRAAGIPARTVWVLNHCYPEFYLVDQEGKGTWFPCQVAGPREFGGISDTRPIFQKGDLFRDPRDRNTTYPLLPETLNGAGGRPQVRFIREMLPQ